MDVGSNSVRSSFGTLPISLKSLHILTWNVHLDQGHHNQPKLAKPAASLPLYAMLWNCRLPSFPQFIPSAAAVAGSRKRVANCRLAAELYPILSPHSLVAL